MIKELGERGMVALCIARLSPPIAVAQVPYDACLDRSGQVIPGVGGYSQSR